MIKIAKITIKEAAEKHGVSKSAIEQMVKRNGLKLTKVKRKVIIPAQTAMRNVILIEESDLDKLYGKENGNVSS